MPSLCATSCQAVPSTSALQQSGALERALAALQGFSTCGISQGRDWFSRQQALADDQQHERYDADCEDDIACLAELPEQQHSPLEKIVAAAGHPDQLGNWVIAMVKPAPALKPTRMLSLIRFTSALSRSSQAIRQRTATVKP